MEAHAFESFVQRYIPIEPERMRVVLTAAIVALIGVELAVLVAWLPDTAQVWWRADPRGDFGDFFTAAEELRPNGLYAPALSLFLYPLTFLSEAAAFRVYLALGALAWLGVAYLAQRGVSSWEARIAVVLGVLSVPQMHWALRLGHLTPMLALIALGGFLLLRNRPVLAGALLALLVLKPQYAPVPALYLLWNRNWRALSAFAAGALALQVAGFAFAGVSEIGPYLGRFADWGSDSRDNLIGVQRAWQYAWPGFLVSLGIEPHPLVVFDLIAVSAVAMWLAWVRSSSMAALAAAAVGMLLITPYSNFYDWGLLIVAGALLLRCETPARAVLLASLVALYGALVITMDATPFPKVDARIALSGTNGELSLVSADFPANGIYWITPLALALVALVALIDGRRVAVAETPVTRTTPSFALRPMGLLAAGVLVPLAYFATAFVGHVAPFEQHYDPFAPSEVVKQLPEDFPIPADGALRDAGQGEQLPYHLEWTSAEPVSEVAGIYRHLLDTEDWELMLQEEDGAAAYRIRLARYSFGLLTHWAMLDVEPYEDGSRISLDLFVPEALRLTTTGR